jgi:hypothetical protein
MPSLKKLLASHGLTSSLLSDAKKQRDAVQKQHSAAASQLAELEKKIEAVILEQYAAREAGEPDADARRIAHEQAIKSARDEATRLGQDLQVLQKRVEREEAAEQAAKEAAAVAKWTKAMKKREPAMLKMEEGIAKAVEGWREGLDATIEAIKLWPGGQAPQTHYLSAFMLSTADLERAVRAELFRLGAFPHLGGGQARPYPDFPGGRPLNVTCLGQPEQTPSLISRVVEANQHAIGTVTGRISK